MRGCQYLLCHYLCVICCLSFYSSIIVNSDGELYHNKRFKDNFQRYITWPVVCFYIQLFRHLNQTFFSNIFINCTSNIMVWAYKISLTLPLLKCLYQVRKMSGHVYECWVSMLPVSTFGY
jgi:hypothetical protein